MTVNRALYYRFSRKDLSLKNCKVDILLITGMLSPYATVVEKLFRDLDKTKVTMLKIERAGDVLVDTVIIITANERGLVVACNWCTKQYIFLFLMYS